jgi:small-conductance mechanosensitive channel
MCARKDRIGHAAIATILLDMDRYLPSVTINRPDYRRCRTVYGLMNTAYRRIDTSKNPEKEYKELQDLEQDLRDSLDNLDTTKGVPVKMTQYLDELKNAIENALAEGVTVDFITQGIVDMLKEEPNAQPDPQPEVVKMIPDTKLKQVQAELAEAKKRIQKLNEENNALALKVKRLEMGKAKSKK